jgi:hypothetical protein
MANLYILFRFIGQHLTGTVKGSHWGRPTVSAHVHTRNRQNSPLGRIAISRHRYPPSLSVYHMRNKGKTVNWREFLRVPGMRLFIRLSSICDRRTLSDAGMGLNWSCPVIAGHIRPRKSTKIHPGDSSNLKVQISSKSGRLSYEEERENRQLEGISNTTQNGTFHLD